MLRRLTHCFEVPGWDKSYHSYEWESFADVLFPLTSVQEARSRTAESILTAMSLRQSRSRSRVSEAFLVEHDLTQEDHSDTDAPDEYVQHALGQAGDREDNDKNASDQEQAAVDNQLLAEAQAYGLCEDVMNSTTTEEPENDSPHESIETDDSASAATPGTTSARHPPSHIENPTDYGESRNSLDYENLIDLTRDSVMTDTHHAEEITDSVMIDDVEDDEEVILIYPAPRHLPIRSPSVMETPTPASRYADRHVHVLD